MKDAGLYNSANPLMPPGGNNKPGPMAPPLQLPINNLEEEQRELERLDKKKKRVKHCERLTHLQKQDA